MPGPQTAHGCIEHTYESSDYPDIAEREQAVIDLAVEWGFISSNSDIAWYGPISITAPNRYLKVPFTPTQEEDKRMREFMKEADKILFEAKGV